MKRLNKDEVKAIKKELENNVAKYIFTDYRPKNFTKLSPQEQIIKNTQEFQTFLYSNGLGGNSATRVSQLTFSLPAYLNVKV